MVVFMCEPDQAYRHQRINNSNRNYPACWINVDSIVLQEPLPLSNVRLLKIRTILE